MTKKDDIILATSDLLQLKGYHGTGINEIVEKSKSPKGSIYHYFKSGKDEIVKEALQFSGNIILSFLQEASDTAGSAEKFVTTIFDIYADEIEKSGFQKGCPVAATALEVSGVHPELTTTIKGIYESWRSVIMDSLKKNITKSIDHEKLASNLISLLEGALLSSKIMRSKEPLITAKTAALSLLQHD